MTFAGMILLGGKYISRPTPPTSDTHTLQSKETRNSTLECMENNQTLKKSGCEDCKQKQKSSHTGKITTQKTG